jgi:hypothetical protein
MDVPMQLHVSNILCANFALALPFGLDVLTRAADKPGLFLEAINILGIRAEKLLLFVKRANKVVRARGGRQIDRLLQLRDERVEYRGRRGVAKQRGVKQVSPL